MIPVTAVSMNCASMSSFPIILELISKHVEG